MANTDKKSPLSRLSDLAKADGLTTNEMLAKVLDAYTSPQSTDDKVRVLFDDKPDSVKDLEKTIPGYPETEMVEVPMVYRHKFRVQLCSDTMSADVEAFFQIWSKASQAACDAVWAEVCARRNAANDRCTKAVLAHVKQMQDVIDSGETYIDELEDKVADLAARRSATVTFVATPGERVDVTPPSAVVVPTPAEHENVFIGNTITPSPRVDQAQADIDAEPRLLDDEPF